MSEVLFPGSFSPPTYGHLDIAKRAAEVFDKVTVVCSRSDEKSYFLSQEECAKLWHSYELPKNVDVITFHEATLGKVATKNAIMVRGIRDQTDYDYEGRVMMYNHEHFGINDYYYVMASEEMAKVSSSSARDCAENLDLIGLSEHVSPAVVTKMLENRLKTKNVIMVTGRPGAGKSTVMSAIDTTDPSSTWFNTDEYAEKLKPMAAEHFGTDDIARIALEQPDELSEVIGVNWLQMLSDDLQSAKGKDNIFVEIAYGLADNKRIYRFIGGKVLYLYCQEEARQRQRVIDRGTPELMAFFDVIPDLAQTQRIAQDNKLDLTVVNTSENAPDQTAANIIQTLKLL